VSANEDAHYALDNLRGGGHQDGRDALRGLVWDGIDPTLRTFARMPTT
jgi:hypothetical protein